MRRWAAVGFGLVALMQAIFFALGGDRPTPYREVMVVSLLGTLALVYGAAKPHGRALAIGFGVNALTRILQPIFGVTRLPVPVTIVLAAGWILACAQAARGRDPRLGIWVLAFGHVLAMMTAFARLESALALALGAIGFFLAAPNMPPRAEA